MTIIGFILGVFIMMIGWAIVENAAFSDRSQFGAWIVVVGLVIFLGAVAEAVFG